MEECQDFCLCGKAVVSEANLRDEYYWKLSADFIGPQSGEGLELDVAPCKNRFMIQVGLLREDNNFPWAAIVDWLRKIFSLNQTADFRTLIERGVATTLSLGSDARLAFLESDVNFNFVGPICDSIGVERQHLLEMRDFSEQAQSVEVTNGLILELSNFVSRERIAPIVIISWLQNFDPDICDSWNIQKAYKVLRSKIKRIKMCCRSSETRSNRRSAAIESLLQAPFELVPRKMPKFLLKKRIKRDEENTEQVIIKEECEAVEIMQVERPEMGTEDTKKFTQVQVQSHADSRSESKKAEKASFKGEAKTLLDIAMLSVQKLSKMYDGKTPACRQLSMDLLKNQYTLTCKEHPAMAEFERIFNSLGEDVSLASPIQFLYCNAHFLVAVHNAVEEHIMNFERELILSSGEKLGRDKLPKFQNFVNMKESATSRYIHMACDILRSHTPNKKSYRKHWVAFCKEMKNPSRLVFNQPDRLSSYFEAAAGLVHHYQETVPFFSDLLSLDNEKCPDIILESVAADAADSMIQSLLCVLAIVYCKILGPYWQLLRSGGEYSLFSHYILCLYQKFLDWSKDPSTLLEPDEYTNIFMQYPLQQKVFKEIFNYYGKWHTNRDLIRACLKRTIKVIAGVTEEYMKDFLPGGIFGQAPPADVSVRLISCTFSVLMADYPFADVDQSKKKNPDKSSKLSVKRTRKQIFGSFIFVFATPLCFLKPQMCNYY
uniref:Zgc:109744 n=1 Tax=Salarias fasciatus TaxID=181472 RepID=A0A672GIZ7_SALFA